MNRYRGPPSNNASKAGANTLCQKCLKRDIFECKAAVQERPYISRPSRTQQLHNPKLTPQLNSDVPNDLLRKKGVADEVLASSSRGRKRSREPTDEPSAHRKRSRSDSRSSFSSVSTISTVKSRSRSPHRGRQSDDSDGDQLMTSQHTSQILIPPSAHERKRRRRESTTSFSKSSSSESPDRSRLERPSFGDRNTRRRRSSISPAERGRRRSRSRQSYSRTPQRRVNSRSRSPFKYGRTHNGHGPTRDDRSRESSARYGEPRRQSPPRRERSLSPYSKRIALTQSMNVGR